MGKKLAIFDFCGTIFKHQSPDLYVDFVAKKNLRSFILQMICKAIANSKYWYRHKFVKLYKIKGLSLYTLKGKAVEFVETIILKDLVDIVIVELDRYINDPEYDVVIASAGYNIYLEYFCRIKNIPYLVASDIEIVNGIATGKMDGIDCFENNKVVKLNKTLDMQQYDLENSVCFSDSMSDKPIFNLVGNKYFVENKGGNYIISKI